MSKQEPLPSAAFLSSPEWLCPNARGPAPVTDRTTPSPRWGMPDADAAHLQRFEENHSLQGVASSSHILSCVQLLAPQGGCCPGSIPSRLNQRWAHTNIIKLGHGRLIYGPDSSDHGDTGHRALNRAKLCGPSVSHV